MFALLYHADWARPALNMSCCPVQGCRGDPGDRGLHSLGVSSNHRPGAPNGRPWHRRSEPPAGDRNSITDHHVYVERHRSQDEVSIAHPLNASRHDPAEPQLTAMNVSSRTGTPMGEITSDGSVMHERRPGLCNKVSQLCLVTLLLLRRCCGLLGLLGPPLQQLLCGGIVLDDVNGALPLRRELVVGDAGIQQRPHRVGVLRLIAPAGPVEGGVPEKPGNKSPIKYGI